MLKVCQKRLIYRYKNSFLFCELTNGSLIKTWNKISEPFIEAYFKQILWISFLWIFNSHISALIGKKSVKSIWKQHFKTLYKRISNRVDCSCLLNVNIITTNIQITLIHI